jgi:hypothetical protein
VVTLCADLTTCATNRLRPVADELEALVAGADRKARAKLEDVLAKVESALEKLDEGDRQGAAGDIEGAAGDLEAAVKTGVVATAVGNRIEEAKAGGGDAAKIDEAERSLARGDARLGSGEFKKAIAKYKDALSKAEGA